MKKIDFRIQLINLLPEAVRKLSRWIFELMELFALAFQFFHEKILEKADSYDYFLSFYNLRKRIEDYLRETLGNDLITIENQDVLLPLTLFQKAESVTIRLYQKSELKGVTATQMSEPINDISFIVFANGSDENKIKALVEEFKILGTKYKIE